MAGEASVDRVAVLEEVDVQLAEDVRDVGCAALRVREDRLVERGDLAPDPGGVDVARRRARVIEIL